jgi:hypothetical protein
MGCGCKGKPVVKPQPTPVPQTVEQYHAQEITKWNGGYK